MWVPIPDPYKWEPQELDNAGVPCVKGRIVVLDCGGERKRFSGQDAVDEAWATGWHDFDRPETADVVWVDEKPKAKAKI